MRVHESNTSLGDSPKVLPCTMPKIVKLKNYGRKKKLRKKEKLTGLKLDAAINRSVFILRDANSEKNGGTGVLFYRHDLGYPDGYLYFGLADRDAFCQMHRPMILLHDDKQIPIFPLMDTNKVNTREVVLFTFESHKRHETIPLSNRLDDDAGQGCFFGGFQADESFDLDACGSDNVDYYIYSEHFQKIYASDLSVSCHETLYCGVQGNNWAKKTDDEEVAEKLLVLTGMPLRKTLSGGAIVSSMGELVGLFNSIIDVEIGLISDLRPISAKIRQDMVRVIARHAPGRYC